MYVGVDYYPEHWDRDRWATDAKLMQEAGFNVVRLAEFAWVFMEPEEGRFVFDWLDDALALLAEHKIDAILCTPTATMPAWVKRTYPEVMKETTSGDRVTWGVRKNNCFTSGTYRLLSERITRAMAEHYTATPNVIGWQTDNEFGGTAHGQCFCTSCQNAFRDWLRQKHGDLEALNRHLGTHFWGQIYYDWAEIEAPPSNGYNPSLCLEWKRFVSHLNVRFQRDQVRILREVCPDHFVTHNLMGLFTGLDYYALAEDLDHVSWDNYPVWGNVDFPYGASMAADLMRGLKRKNFWIMEQTAGPGGWDAFGRNPRPGEIRKIAYQQLAHGCDGQVWFRWRTCTAGREQYWHGLLGHDGKPLRRYREAAATAREYHELAAHLADTAPAAQVAMIYDYQSIWALEIQPGFPTNKYTDAVARHYNALLRAGVGVEMVPPDADLSGYAAVFAPDLYVLPDTVAERLDAYVRDGGVLVTDCRTGVKDEHNLCHARTLPGLLSECLGITIEEYDALNSRGGDSSFPIHGQNGFSGSYTAEQYVDWLTPAGAEVLADYDQWHLADFAALTRHRYGKGTGYYVGAVVREPAFYDALVAEVLSTAGVEAALRPPEGVEAAIREGENGRFLFLLNHTEEERKAPLPAGAEMLIGEGDAEEVRLDRFDVAVLRLP
ncbi:MAG: beta-galactosidase [Planctomycetota bacterium]